MAVVNEKGRCDGFYEDIDDFDRRELVHFYQIPFVRPHEVIMERLEETLNVGLTPTPSLLFFSIKSVVLEE
mgnify:CR=1 FL=1|jgi:hypothetical protein